MPLFNSLPPRAWNKPRLASLLAKIRAKRILIVGDVGIDRYTQGEVKRICPEAPVPIVRVEKETHKLGLAANVADNVQVLEGVPVLVGVLGSDAGAKTLRGMLQKAQVPARHLIVDRSRRTTLKERVVSGNQQLLRVDYESEHAMSAAVERAVLARIRPLLRAADGVILQDYAKGLVTAEVARGVFALARAARKRVAVDPNAKTDITRYRGAFLLTPNRDEAETFAGALIRDEASLARAGQRILKATQARHVVVTLGKDGMAIFTRGSRAVTLLPTFAREVYDVSGAGDTVISMLALGLAAGATLEEACILGNLAAGVEVGKRGTATVTQDEVRGALELFAR